MKSKLFFLMLLFFAYAISAQSVPEWVNIIDQNKTFADEDSCYIGIGISQISQENADNQAKDNFIVSLGKKIITTTEENFSEINGYVSNSIKQTHRSVSENIFFNIRILHKYYSEDKQRYYSLIKKNKIEYAKQLTKEIEMYLKIKQNELQMIKKENKIKSQIQEEKVQKEKLAQAEKERYLKRYEDFKNMPTNESLIKSTNGQFPSASSTISIKSEIDELRLKTIESIIHGKNIGIGLHGYFKENNKLDYQAASIRFRLLNDIGNKNPFGLACGVIAFQHNKIEYPFEDYDFFYTPYIGGYLKSQQMLHTVFSAYADRAKFAFGVASYPFFNYWNDAISFICEYNNYINEDVYAHENASEINLGLNIHTSDNFNITFSYDNFDKYLVKIQIGK